MLYVLRGIFVIITGIIGWYIGLLFPHTPGNLTVGYVGVIACVILAILFVIGEIILTRRYVGTISLIMFGLIFGFVVSSLFIQVLFLLPWVQHIASNIPDFKDWLSFAVTFLFSYISIIAIIKSRDEFKFVIPFIELSREGKTIKPFILDTSAIIDGRIADVAETKIMQTQLILPRFVLMELQRIADSADRSKRMRGRHGLDILNKMQSSKNVDIVISEIDPANIGTTDSKLVELTRHLNGRLVTTDFNLNKVAQLQGVEVVNVNDLVNALKQVVLPGEFMEIKIIKEGEESHQGVGYLNDGTMVVVEGARSKLGQKVNVNVTSVIQTSAGRMIFGTLAQK
jgi:uncharacterized protein YacL